MIFLLSRDQPAQHAQHGNFRLRLTIDQDRQVAPARLHHILCSEVGLSPRLARSPDIGWQGRAGQGPNAREFWRARRLLGSFWALSQACLPRTISHLQSDRQRTQWDLQKHPMRSRSFVGTLPVDSADAAWWRPHSGHGDGRFWKAGCKPAWFSDFLALDCWGSQTCEPSQYFLPLPTLRIPVQRAIYDVCQSEYSLTARTCSS